MTLTDIMHAAGELPASHIAGALNAAVERHGAAVVTAPPGAGKSTLLPLTLLAGGAAGGKILMLEPRRIAARQIAERMASLLGENTGQTVGYRVRFESRVSAATRIEVLTEGILTRMLIDDPTLDGVGLIVFDEFHERSLNTDLAFALTRQAKLIIRPDLRIVVMSATIDAGSICDALGAPLIKSDGRMFDVDIRYAGDDTQGDVAQEAAATVCRAHREHKGDILVFLPGQGEIERCAGRLEGQLGDTTVCQLYGNLPPDKQRKAIAPSAEGKRKVVIATPIAETSLTIEDVRVVVDSGLCRSVVYDNRTAMSQLQTVRISMDMAAQRAGRAGRVAEGVCYRLWTKSSEHLMARQRKPEITDADLTAMVLDTAAFGESDIAALPWLTPPPTGNVARARQLLTALGALDAEGRITSYGKRMAAMPCHPRMARMILSATTPALRCLACDIAAILEEKDPMAEQPDTDLTLRVAALRAERRRKPRGPWARMAMIAADYRRMAHASEHDDSPAPHDVGMLLAHAYPERVAMATDATGHFRLASGDNAQTGTADSMTAYQWIAVAALGGNAAAGRIFLAAPLDPSDLDGSIAGERDNVSWDYGQGCVVARHERRIGKLTISSKPIHGTDRKQTIGIVCEAVRKDGASLLNWDDATRGLQRRVGKVAEWHPELDIPDISAEHVIASADEWLPFYLEQDGHIRQSVAELRRIDMHEALWAMIPYDTQKEIDRLAPTFLQVPTGSRIRIDYRQGAEAPVLSVRLQECFGMEQTPYVDDGRRPILMELLSPGYKPVQLTQDLGSFWSNTYFEVRKELRRRYPKHYWPENPLEAEAVRGVRKATRR